MQSLVSCTCWDPQRILTSRARLELARTTNKDICHPAMMKSNIQHQTRSKSLAWNPQEFPAGILSSRDRAQSRASVTADVCLGQWHPCQMGVQGRHVALGAHGTEKAPLCVCVLVALSCATLCDPMDCSPPGSPVHGIVQARILECVAISFSRKLLRDRQR